MKMNMELYRLNHEFTRVLSPIDGQISRYYLTLGNLVNQDQTLLTTVVSVDPMYVYFEMDEPTLLRIRRAVNEGKIQAAARTARCPSSWACRAKRAIPHQGTINFVNNQVNPTTGSILVRGVFPNPLPKGGHRLLSPGMFVRIRLPIGGPHQALLVIDRAVGSDQGLKFVYVLDADNKVQSRRVTTGALQDDGLRVIEDGLKPDDWVVVGGILQVRPRMEVRPDRVPMPTLGQTLVADTAPRKPSRRLRNPRPHLLTERPRLSRPRPRLRNRRRRLRIPSRAHGDQNVGSPTRQKPGPERAPRHDLTLLHRPADLRDGAVDRHHLDRRDRAMFWLPIAQYPRITPPGVSVTINYPGASAQVVADTVAAPIEQQVNGVEGMLYMSSQMGNDGSYTLTVTFDIGTDLNTALVMVQNRVALAMPQLPTQVQNQGITIRKKTPDILMIVNFFSPDGRYDDIYLSNFATIYVKDELLRVYGVSDINYMGQRDYSIRAWLDPQKLAARNMTAMDVAGAIRSQNVDAPAGQIGQLPVSRAAAVPDAGRYAGPAHRSRAVRLNHRQGGRSSRSHEPATAIVRLRDVARIELGAQNYNQSCTFDGHPSVGLSIYQLPGTNALDVADRVRAKMEELKTRFPDGVDYAIAYDTTLYISESIPEVGWTLIYAVILVGIVVLLFLQDWKAMILPMIDVPVSLIGTVAVMAAMGFSLNNLTLFGLVLAIGIVVDDAIVVLENTERMIAKGFDARTATIKAMEEITGPILAITLALCSVFVPCCFLGGITGQFFRQFAVTIAVSTIISAVNALTMTPSRAVLIFKTEQGSHGHEFKREALPWWFFGLVGGILAAWFGPGSLAARFGVPASRRASDGPKPSSWMSWIDTAAYFAPGAGGRRSDRLDHHPARERLSGWFSGASIASLTG